MTEWGGGGGFGQGVRESLCNVHDGGVGAGLRFEHYQQQEVEHLQRPAQLVKKFFPRPS